MTELVQWKTANDRKPLILKGVRQCGKTYLLEQFGSEHFSAYHIINFEKQRDARTLFDGDLEPEEIVDALRTYLNVDISIENDLIIFDEIQTCPTALTSLKYFCEELPQLALCAAGSLLGFHLSKGSYPVGKVDMKYLHPLSFGEFLNGIGDTQLYLFFQQIDLTTKIPELIHNQLWESLKNFFITGGLPEVVTTFKNRQENLFDANRLVHAKQEELLNAYYADIAKHAGKVNATHIHRTFMTIPKQLSDVQDGSTNRFRFKNIIPNVNRYSQLVHVIDWLDAAELVIKLPVINCVEQPLSAQTKENIFKLMMFDVGILGASSGLDPSIILNYDYGTYQGYFAENFVAQELQAANNDTIFTWHKDKSEIEFVLSLGSEVTPIEVKTGTRVGRAKSLEKFIKLNDPEKNVILSANNMRCKSENNVIHLPLYLAGKISDLI